MKRNRFARGVALSLPLLSLSCVQQTEPRPTPAPAPNAAPAPVPVAQPSPSRLPVEKERRRFVPKGPHAFRQDELVKLSTPEGGAVWLYRDVAALEAGDTAKATSVPAGQYAKVKAAYAWSGDLEIQLLTGDNTGSRGSIRRGDCLFLDGKLWKR